MKNKILFLFVEGNDDELFFERVIKPRLSGKYIDIKTWKYSQQTKENLRNFLANVKSMQAKGVAECVFVADLDEFESVRARQKKLLHSYQFLSGNEQERDRPNSWIRLLIVCKEIESWYLAGLDSSDGTQIGFKKVLGPTDKISKEEFNKMIPSRFNSRIDFMQEILNLFRIDVACKRNASFDYLIRTCVDHLD